jgi:hypothetical protein
LSIIPYSVRYEFADKNCFQADRLVPVLPQYQRTSGGMIVLDPSRRHLPTAVSAFIGMVVEKLSAVETLPELRSGQT